MKFLISGAGGQLGQEWFWFKDKTKTSDEFVALNHSDFDITDRSSVKKVIKNVRPDVLINCAAYTNVDGAEEEKEKADLINHQAVRTLAEECALADIKLVHYSTDYVFPGREEDEKTYPDGYPEDAVKSPLNVYGDSKLAGEQALKQFSDNYLLIRVSWLCGSYGNNFVKTMLKLGGERDELSVVNDQVGSPSYTFDVVLKTLWLIQQNKTGIYHVSSKGRITWADFAEEIFNQAGMNTVVNRVTSEEFKRVAKRPAFSLLSNRKIENEGAVPISWKIGLNELLNRLSL